MTQEPRRIDERKQAHLVLADGSVWSGVAIGADRTSIGEVVFTTGMTGYQEVLTDPSYCEQIVTMTAPEMGNVGINPEDLECDRSHVAGFVINQLSPIASNWRAKQSLDEYLRAQNIAGIA